MVLVTNIVAPPGLVSFPCKSRVDFDLIVSQDAKLDVIKEVLGR